MDSKDLRLAVYRAFAGTGRAPEHGELAGQLGYVPTHRLSREC
jgi:hypothetical protein